MKQFLLALGVLIAATLACGPSITNASVTVTTFVDETGNGEIPESYLPLPDTLVIAEWNQHGAMYRDVTLTDQNGRAEFSVDYTHFFDVSVFPPCGYYSTTPLQRDVTDTEYAAFGFWPADPVDRLSTVMVLVWRDVNANGARDAQEEITGEKAGILFEIPGGMNGYPYSQDNFVQDSDGGWFNVSLGNSCGTIHLLLMNSDAATRSVSEPGRDSDAGAHGNTIYPSIEIPYEPGETTVYWEIK
jgi:hypothetical protein